ncbi:MAG TPA: DinB family protein [Gemmataceae bacterium]|nr:DinB family protein [Gemmataceae bacterium]
MNEKTLANEYTAEARRDLAACLTRVKHCLGQLDDGQLWRRPRPGMHAVGELVLHLCGSLRRHFVSVVGATAGDRGQRGAGEGAIPKAELLLRLEEAVGAADAAVAGLTAERLLQERRYAGLRGEVKATVLAVVQRTLMRCCGHAQEILYSVRLLLGEGYKFLAPAADRKRLIAADDVLFAQGMLPPLPAEPPPTQPTPPVSVDVAVPAVPSGGTPPSLSPLHDHLLELEQEFQNQQEEGKV